MEGYFFVAALLGLAVMAWRRQSTKPVAFGILWFFSALLPTSLMPLADVTNDHRMFFPFVGLTLAVVWSVRLVYFRITARLTVRDAWVYGLVGLSMVLGLEALATRVRNRVWLTEESLWADATEKNPRNARAWTNYGSAFFRQGDYQAALANWEKAAMLDPGCVICEENLVRVLRQLHRPELTEQHFQRVLDMHPPIPGPYIDFAEWLESERRFDDSSRILDHAAQLYPHSQEFWRAHRKLFLRRDAAVRLPLFQLLDADRDTVLSAQEILAAPDALPSLDKNRDGKLSAEECGANFGDESRLTAVLLRKARIAFMQSDPVLRALDADRDGEISAREIRGAQRELATLDQNGDGQLETIETVPEEVVAAVRRLMAMLDLNHDGKIGVTEWPGENFSRLRSLLAAADIDGDGDVTPEELAAQIFYEADRHKEGVVTAAEMAEMGRSGALGPPSPPAASPHRI
jgi:tetratricopeptide (TPR) repeat protein